MAEKIYDVIIVGGGVAGLGAAVYTRRFGLKTLILAELPGGTITQTHLVENYPGFVSLSGQELADHFMEHVKSVEAEIKTDRVKEITRDKNNLFIVKTSEEKFLTTTILFATGTHHKRLEIPSVIAFENKGVSYCATCDGPLFKGKTLAVVGAGDSATKEALLLTKFGTKVYIIVRGDDIHPEPINKIRADQNSKIEIIRRAKVIEARGSKFLEEIILDTSQTLAVQGLFIEIGRIPQTELVKNLGVEQNELGEIKIDRKSKTNIEGFFAAGDVTDTEWKQAITGVGEGAQAANSIYEYLTRKNTFRGEGFEPSLHGSEPCILPLDDPRAM